ncbi:MerR family DNA-binding transcriptional regulator [Kibdelosporangium aridum]|uniref:MerR family DNA-binding transcriptional regulator n=1 Tax=Kibdelosporangium aridum TaxID=2030 RepID=A0A428Z0W0_KIBAR|nr:MerR family transcriptional regulator [Kibdelosporangium aridum]RSM78162.1 MerR family DNA-binding transcriptional regulator [Kibdelosporangium aridum]
MWRIGQLARMVGTTERTLRHYDRIGLLAPAAVDPVSGYRWYGVAELVRLERIRALRRLGLPLRLLAEVVDASDAEIRRVLRVALADLDRQIDKLTEVAEGTRRHLASATALVPHVTTAEVRRLRVCHLTVEHPSEIAAACADEPSTLVTWLRGRPDGAFVAAVGTGRTGDPLVLPARTVARVTVTAREAVVGAGYDLFDWLASHRLTVSGPTVETRLVDGDGVSATVLEVPFAQSI